MPSHADGSQTTLALQAAAPLDVLVLETLSGHETLNGLFQLELVCSANDAGLDLEAALGQHLTVTLGADSAVRQLDGQCAAIRQRPGARGLTEYVIELRPWLWWLTLASDHRIFQNMTVPEIVAAVIDAAGQSDVASTLRGSYVKRDYCVQYGESHFVFISRLLEDEGIFYYFRHGAGVHTLVLADAVDDLPACPGSGTIDFMPPSTGAREAQAIRQGDIAQRAVSAGFGLSDFAFVTPATSLLASAGAQPAHFSYPGGHASKPAGDARAALRTQEQGALAQVLSGESDSRALVPGHCFTLAGHPRAAANSGWIVTEVRHAASHAGYSNRFGAIPAATPYRPPRATRRPRIAGTQTAIVVGKSGEEIWTDEYGRIKVQFHWDRAGALDGQSSCWVRVAQLWAGKGWGAQFIPRIGQEVVVSFLEGDPDRPLVTGCVYNGANPLPYPPPGQKNTSAIKSQSTKGGEGFNELRLDDTKDAELFYLHAQKDMTTDVLHDATATVGNDEQRTVKQHQRLEVQEGDRSVTVTKGKLTTSVAAGAEVHGVKGTRGVTVDGAETHANKADFTHTVDGGYTLTIKGDLTIDVSGAISIKAGTSIAIEAGTGLSSKAGTSLSNQAGTELTNKAGTSLTNDAGLTLTNKAGASQTVDGGGMLTVKGGLVKIN